VEAERAEFLADYDEQRLDGGRRTVVRNGYQLERRLQTGIGAVEVRVPKVRDRSDGGAVFHCKLLPHVYWWADGIYSNVRLDDRLCLLVLFGVTEHGHKEHIAVEDGYRESAASWQEVLSGLDTRGLRQGAKLAVGDGSLGFWKALGKLFATVRLRTKRSRSCGSRDTTLAMVFKLLQSA
jgi:putative transposase